METLNSRSTIGQSASFKPFIKSKVVKPIRFIPIMYVPNGYLASFTAALMPMPQ